MDYTTNLNLKKPNVNEYYSIGDINDNMDTIDEALQDLSTGSGDLSGLTTTAKDSLVEAINELDGNIGDLSGLTTTAKTNLVNAVNELNTNVSELNQKMSVIDVTDKFSFSIPSKISDFHALKYGRLIRLNGLLTNITENFIITALDNSVYPMHSVSLTDKVLNYNGWQPDAQKMVNIIFSGTTIIIEANSTSFSYTALETWYLSEN